MGLDMYLMRAPRYRGYTMDDVEAVESWLELQAHNSSVASKLNAGTAKDTDKKYTYKEWCGREKEPSAALVNAYKPYWHATYSSYDTNHEHPWYCIRDEVGYWRKANAIHEWFVQNVQNGEDDCEWHREVMEEDLRELISVCKEVIGASKMVPAKLESGYTMKPDGTTEYHYEDGYIIEDPSVAEELLPTQSGFFFGGTGYDSWYIQDLKDTVKICEKILDTTDFDKQMVYYRSSW